MDDADRAAKFAQDQIDFALMAVQAMPRLPYTGQCHWCDAPVGPKLRFCDRYCAEDFELDQRRQQERGRG